jgi:transposase
VKQSLRSLAKRYQALEAEIREHDTILEDVTPSHAPTLREGIGIGAGTAAEMLIVFGDDLERIHSEAAFAKLCGASPVPASSGLTNRHRLSRAGHREANAALYRAVIVRMRFHQSTIDSVARRTAEGLSKRDIIRCLIGGVSGPPSGRMSGRGSRSCRRMASLPRPCQGQL